MSGTFLAAAFEEARAAGARGEVPVGAVVTQGERIVAAAGNRVEELADASAHAEILALRAAGTALGSPRLIDCDLWVSLEPCPMCAAAISMARIRRLYFGAYDPKGGGVDHGPRIFQQTNCRHRPEVVGGLDEAVAARLLREFFAEKR